MFKRLIVIDLEIISIFGNVYYFFVLLIVLVVKNIEELFVMRILVIIDLKIFNMWILYVVLELEFICFISLFEEWID